ncbi:MAG: putative zinc-binding metallopeptidase [Vicinamibacteria bacterium]|nr:putative zinc-binding metallopeptidase [Vicinamibacteria bacterium]
MNDEDAARAAAADQGSPRDDENAQARQPPPRCHRRGIRPPSEWENWKDEQLLELKLCRLDLRIANSDLDQRVAQLLRELDERGLVFRPHFWLSDEWFCPDGVPGVAIPFYLAHPRLARLEQTQMLEVEGGTPEWCMRILRHETGHAIENAYRLRRRRKRREIFGSTRQPYPEYYAPRPYSKNFVSHIESWYAQSHPDEDFAETFAVWLTPGADWRNRYAGWPVLRKLEYMDALMRELSGKAPPVTSREEHEPLLEIRKTLREHYRRKRERYGVNRPQIYDRELRRLFSDAPEHAGRPTAASYLSRIRIEVRRRTRRWTGVYQYTIDQVLKDIIQRCRELNLRLTLSEEETKLEFTGLLTMQTMHHLHAGRHRVAL